MILQTERTWTVTLRVEDLVETCRLYAQFSSGGCLASFHLSAPAKMEKRLQELGATLISQSCEPALLDELLKNVLAPIGRANSLEFIHRVTALDLRSDVSFGCNIRERQWADGNPGEDWEEIDTLFDLLVELADRVIELRTHFDIRSAFWELEDKHGLRVQVCGHCRLGDTPPYQLGDGRHGLFCLRDSIATKEFLEDGSSPEWDQVAWSAVDALHWCPRFEPKPIVKRHSNVGQP